MTVKEQPMYEEGLHMLLCDAEAIINCRSIIKASSDLNDLDALTHIQQIKPEFPQGVFNKEDHYANHIWRQGQYLMDIWRKE